MMATAANANQGGRKVNTFDIFVGNLPQDVDQKKVGKLFSKFGEVHNIWINGQSDGNKFAIVKFYCEEDSTKAIEDTNGLLFEGKPLTCRKSTRRGPKKESDQDGPEKEEGIKQQMPPIRQRNPDIVPSFENSSGFVPSSVPSSIPSSIPSSGPGFNSNRKERERVLISYVETPVIMWGQKIQADNIDELTDISEQLAILCPESPAVMGRPDQDKIYGAKFSEDGQWYRCSVRYYFGQDRVKVQYIDYGNTEEIDPTNLVELPKTVASLPTCAMKYMLHYLWCPNNQDVNGIGFLRDLVESKEVEIITTARLTDQTGYYSEVYVNGVSVIDKLLEAGHAYRKPGLDMRGGKARTLGGAGDAGMNASGKVLPQAMLGQRKFDGPQEKDEMSSLRWKLKTLQSEYTHLSNQVQENDIASLLHNLQILSIKARKYRNQFPVDKTTPLDMAIDLAQSPDCISISMAQSLPSVVSSINAYKSSQDEILKCSDNTQIEELVVKRDAVRKELHAQLKVTIDELEEVPLQDRGKQVQDVVAALIKHYDYFTKLGLSSLPAIDSLIPKFQEWKVQKSSEVTDARRMSDTMESKVGAVWDQTKQLISLESDQEDVESGVDVTPSLKEYTKALQHENSVSNTENGPDSILIGSLVQCLLRDLREECNCVDHLCNVKKEFNSLLEQISPWLESAPSLDNLQQVRSKLKSLKSKLRHKLADKVDAEENQETEELETIAKDLEEIRTKLHDALTEENKMMSEIGKLANDHFPELLSGQQDTGLKDYLMFKGLVKTSYAPEHFTMSILGNSSSAMFSSHFAGQPVIIKEYFLNSGNHLGKDEFLMQLSAYSGFSSPFLEPVSAVFFDKNNRHGYVLTSQKGQLLSQLVENSPPTKETCQTILQSLCNGLECLQHNNFIHGQIKPEFVMVDEDGMARLLPPDFSFPVADRCSSRFLPSSNQEMLAPELKHQRISSEPSHFTDVYCLGLLALWMHHPNARFLERKDGAVDISQISVDRNLGIFLTKLLASIPSLRPVASNILHSEYLNHPIEAGVESPNSSSMMQRSVQGMSNTGYSDLDAAQMKYARNSSSPASILPQTTNNGLIYADTGSSYQMIANTRVPPPSFSQENPAILSHPGVRHVSPSMMGGSNPSFSQMTPHYQQQQPPQQNQFPAGQNPQQQQQQQQQQQMPAVLNADQEPHNENNEDDDSKDSFEIGTFDPTAYEVTSHPADASTQPDAAINPTSSQPPETSINGADETELQEGNDAEIGEWSPESEDSESLQTST